MYKPAAQQLAAMGRNGDTMLVHMSPREVAGLQALARNHGTSLTINPQTGQPEAFSLGSLLPAVAGIGLTAMSGGTLSPLMAGMIVGAGHAAMTGFRNPLQSAMAGLGAYGGAGIGEGLTAASAAAPEAAAASPEVMQAFGPTAAPSAGAQGFSFPSYSGFGASEAAQPFSLAEPGMVPMGAQAAPTPSFENMGKGLSNVFSGGPTGEAARSAFMGKTGYGQLAGVGLPILQSMATQPGLPGVANAPSRYYKTSYSPGQVNPRFGEPGQPYYVGQSYGKGEYYAEGGIVPQSNQIRSPSFDETDTYEKVEEAVKQLTPSKLELLVSDSDDPIVQGAASRELDRRRGAGIGGYGLSKTQFMAEGGLTSPYFQTLQNTSSGGLADYLANLNASLAATQPIAPVRPMTSAPASSVGGYTYDPVSRMFNAPPPKPPVVEPEPVEDKGYDGGDYAGGLKSLEYAAGGKLLSGRGDGMSDSIPAVIRGDKPQRAALADGEFVVPADVVSGLGNGSTKAGAERLHGMMDRVRSARTGTKRQAPQINAKRMLPA